MTYFKIKDEHGETVEMFDDPDEAEQALDDLDGESLRIVDFR